MNVWPFDWGRCCCKKNQAKKFAISFLSSKLFDWEKKFAAIKKEVLAIKWAIDLLCYYLMGN